MKNNKESLVLELKQIIQADRMAGDVIKDAEAIREKIEAATEKQKADIVAGVKRETEQLEIHMREEQEKTLAACRQALEDGMAAKDEALQAHMRAHSAQWAEEIVARMIAP